MQKLNLDLFWFYKRFFVYRVFDLRVFCLFLIHPVSACLTLVLSNIFKAVVAIGVKKGILFQVCVDFSLF